MNRHEAQTTDCLTQKTQKKLLDYALSLQLKQLRFSFRLSALQVSKYRLHFRL